MKFFRILLYVLSILTIIYLFGPQPEKPAYAVEMPAVPAEAAKLESYIKDMESRRPVKPENEARIIWQNDSLKK